MIQRFTEPQSTLIIALLDASGSMLPKTADTIGGFNTFLADQRKGPDPARLILLTFATGVTIVHEATPLDAIPDLTPAVYRPSGNTALYDAVIEAVVRGGTQRRPEDRVLVLIVTDGEENASRKATLASVKATVTEKQAAGDWTFVYLGPDPDAWAAQTGTVATNVAAYQPQRAAEMYGAVSAATTSYRITPTWAAADLTVTGEAAKILKVPKKSDTPTT